MSNISIELKLHHTKIELLELYKKEKNPIEKTRLHFLSIIRNKDNNSSTLAVSISTGMKRVGMKLTWAQDTIRRYNKDGLNGIKDGRKNNQRPKILKDIEQKKLKEKITKGETTDGGLWTGPKVAKYIGEILGKKVNATTGWRYLKSLGFSIQTPRLSNEKKATKKEQEAFKKKLKNSSKKQKKKKRK